MNNNAVVPSGSERRKVNLEEFFELINRTGLKERAARMAKAFLVEGEHPSEIARKENVSRQLVSQAVDRVWKEKRRRDNVPEEWKTLTISLPENWVKFVEYLEEVERVKAGRKIKVSVKHPELSKEEIETVIEIITKGK